MNLSYAEQNQYNTLSKFNSIEEFNNHFEQIMLIHKEKFSKGEYIALNKLRKFAAAYFGVAWCKIQKAVAATHQDETFGISRSTFERMLRKAKKLNILSVVNQKRKNNYLKHNVFIFNTYDETVEIVSKSQTIEVPETEKIDGTRTNNLIKLTKQNIYNTYSIEEAVQIIEEKKIDYPKTDYQKLQALFTNVFETKSTISKLYGCWIAQTYRIKHFKQDYTVALEAGRILLLEIKRRYHNNLKPLINPVGYYNGTLKKLIDHNIELQSREAYQHMFELIDEQQNTINL